MAISPSTSYVDTEKREEKSHGSLFFPVACYAVVLPESTIPFHWHDEFESLYVVNGQLEILFGTEKLLLNKGEGAFINSNIIHSHKAKSLNKEQTLIHTIVFHPRLISEMNNQICWNKYIRPIINNNQLSVQKLTKENEWQKKILSCIQISWEYLAYDKFGFELKIRNELSEILLTLLEHQHISDISIMKNDHQNNERLKQILMYIQCHYFEQISLDDIVKITMKSRSSCLRFFQTTLGTTPLSYINQYRLLVAAQYLKETDWRVSEIGYRCGFNEMGYFSAQFKKKFGITPKEYRKNFK